MRECTEHAVTVGGQHRQNGGIGMFFKVGRFKFTPFFFNKINNPALVRKCDNLKFEKKNYFRTNIRH